ncbi:MAG: hypothetical protein AAF586_08850, partial [Planctomycetota bacterium]
PPAPVETAEPADAELPSPDFDDEVAEPKPGLADSVSAWDELELSPWEDGDDLAALLGDDDDPDPSGPGESGDRTPPAPSAEADAPAETPLPASEDEQEPPPGLLPRRSSGGGSLLWAGLLIVLIPAGLWASQRAGWVDLSSWVSRSAEPTEEIPPPLLSSADQAEGAAAVDVDEVDMSSAEPVEVVAAPVAPAAPAVPEIEPIVRNEPEPVPASEPVVEAAATPPDPDDVTAMETALAGDKGSSDADTPMAADAAEVRPDDRWLAAMKPTPGSALWVDAAPLPSADRPEPDRVTSMLDAPELGDDAPTVEAMEDSATAAANDVPSIEADPVDAEALALFPAALDVAIAHEVSVATSDVLVEADAVSAAGGVVERMPEVEAELEAGALADALAELEAPRAVVTAGPTSEDLHFVEVQGVPGGRAPSADAAAGSASPTRLEGVAYADPAGGGRRVVYLVDASGSMIDSFGAVGGWLERDIAELAPQDRFAVLFFSDGRVIESPPAGLKRPTPRRRSELGVYMQPSAGAVIPAGRSDVRAAIDRALDYRPDRLVIVSDNNLQRRVSDDPLDVLVAAILPAVDGSEDFTLDAVQLFYDDPRGLMRDLAQRFGGRFERVEPSAGDGEDNPLNFLLR